MNEKRMHQLLEFIQRRPALSATIALILFLVTAALMRKSGECLKTSLAPAGIVSFELALTKNKADAIKAEWLATSCEDDTTLVRAIFNTYLDFLFIMGYASFLIVLAVLFPVSGNPRFRFVPIQFMLVAALCDVVENVFMLLHLNGASINPLSFGVFASVKFGLLVLTMLGIIIGLGRRVIRKNAGR